MNLTTMRWIAAGAAVYGFCLFVWPVQTMSFMGLLTCVQAVFFLMKTRRRLKSWTRKKKENA